MTALLTFSGILADAVRIMAAKKQVQNALNTAARSVLSGYNSELIGDYGIFALEGLADIEAVNNELVKYITANLNQKGSTYDLVKYNVETCDNETAIECYGSIFNNDILKRQINEFMKYRAPLSITDNIIEKFKKSGLYGKLEYSIKESTSREKRDELNVTIKGTNEVISEVIKFSDTRKDGKLYEIKDSLLKVQEISSNITQPLSDYYRSRDEVNTTANSLNEENEGIVAVNGNTEFDDVQVQYDLLKNNVESVISEVNEAIQAVESINASNDILKKRVQDLYDEVQAKQSAINELNIEKIKSEIDVLEDEIGYINEEIDVNDKAISSIENNVDIKNIQKISTNEPESTEKGQPDYSEGKSAVNSILTKLTMELGTYLKNIKSEWLIDRSETDESYKFNTEMYMDMKEDTQAADSITAENNNNSVLDFMKTLAEGLEKGRDKLYTVEYVMRNFDYLTSAPGKGHYFEKGEIEYILWEDENQLSNILKTLSSVWFIRFAINSTDNFAVSSNPHPVFRLIYAMAKGFIQACSDISTLYNGGDIAICPSMQNIKIGYEDHLRVLLLLQASVNEGRQFDNIRQLIQTNIIQLFPGFKLKNCTTVIRAQTEVTINLWFLPLFKLDMLGFDKFKGGRYAIRKEIYLGY